LQDTLNEMKLVISNYKKYGDPKLEKPAPPTTQSASAEEMKWPEKDKVTLKWLVEHMPATIWLGLIAAFCAVAVTAVGVGY
jgi:hypothetical protein